MKKILLILISLLCLCSCKEIGKKDINPDQRYLSIIDSIKQHDTFLDTSNYFDISAEMAKIDDGYRYYVTIDNSTAALYDVEALAIEQDVDYTNVMAANVGVFEDKEYALVPNQKNPDKGYVSGVVISGTSKQSRTTLYVYVSFKNEDHSATHVEYFKLNVEYGENNG